MLYGSIDLARAFCAAHAERTRLRSGEFWAVRDCNFHLDQGESIAIIGANGSGKSTLLKMLNGIFMPDVGRITVRGRVGALLELGAGFHPMLSGRENIYINGTILGMTKREIDERFADIVAFADIDNFLDAPVKHYSSGMYVRLGFAVAIHARPDVLLIDEVLRVGDASFQKKCIDRIQDLRRVGTALVFVSHAISAVERLCTRCLVMNYSEQVFLGDTREGVRRYFEELGKKNVSEAKQSEKWGLGTVAFSQVRVYEEGKDPDRSEITFGKNIVLEFDYLFAQKDNAMNQVRISLRTLEGRDVQKFILQESPFPDGKVYPNEKLHPLGRKGRVRLVVRHPRLSPQTFRVDVGIATLDTGVHLGALVNAAVFNVVYPEHEQTYFEVDNLTVTEFDYEMGVEVEEV